MTLFITSAALILLLTLYLLARPLLKTRNTISYEREAQNIHYARERLEELEEQLKNASISATDYEALKLEIESNLASDIDLRDSNRGERSAPPQRSNKWLLSTLAVALPLSVVGVYLITGTPSALAPQTASTERPSAQEVESMLVDIEQRLKTNPNDAKGWAVLSQTYLALGRYREARDGFLKLLELEGESARVLTSIADASGLMADGKMSGEPEEYARRALELEPNNPQALWLAGLSAAQKNNNELARTHWQKLLPMLANEPKQQQELQAIIDQTFEQQALVGSPLAAQSVDADNAATALTIAVSLDSTMASKVNPSDLVFVFARAETGPPAPLAVKRLTVADLPATVSLGDADAMLPTLKISMFDNVMVSARVAKSGQPIAQTGDIQSALTKVQTDSDDKIVLIIDTEVE